jgi:hypothetical protein
VYVIDRYPLTAALDALLWFTTRRRLAHNDGTPVHSIFAAAAWSGLLSFILFFLSLSKL